MINREKAKVYLDMVAHHQRELVQYAAMLNNMGLPVDIREDMTGWTLEDLERGGPR